MSESKKLKAMAAKFWKSRLPFMREMGDILEACVLAVDLAEELEDWALHEPDEPCPATIKAVDAALESLYGLDELVHASAMVGVRSRDLVAGGYLKLGELDDAHE